MNIFILFWVKSFLMAHPICPCFKYENIKIKHLVYIFFKMRMKAKTYEINFLVANHLQLNIFLVSNDLQLKSLSHMFWLSISS
jgi:superfamily I DNA and/or RNA helicase